MSKEGQDWVYSDIVKDHFLNPRNFLMGDESQFNYDEVRKMAVIYVALIVKGKRTYDSVPELIKPQVKEMLIDLELADLVTE